MPLTLTSREIQAVQDCAAVLTSPLSHESVDVWRAQANRSLKQLTGADTAGFMLPGVDGPLLFSEDHDVEELSRYPEMDIPAPSDVPNIWVKGLEQRISTIATLYGPDLPAYYASAYYNEYAAPNGACDTLGATVGLLASAPSSPALASVQLWRDGPRGAAARSFGARERQILSLVYPALVAGIESLRSWHRHRVGLIGTIDSLGAAVLITDGAGRRLHETAAFSSIIAGEVGGDAVASAVDGILRALVHLEARSSPTGAVPGAPVLDVTTGHSSYRVSGSAQGSTESRDRLLLVTITRTSQPGYSAEHLQHRFRLTRTECRVAAMLAAGHSNTRIASSLGVASSTARRHTESVFRKLGVHSRSAVAPRLAEPD